MEAKILETEHGGFTGNTETGQTAEEVYQVYLEGLKTPQEKSLTEIDILLKENKQLWDTVAYLLKDTETTGG